MKYIVRSIKYFIYFVLLLIVLIGLMKLFGMVEGGIESIFKDGWDSVGKIAILFALVSAVYPMVGFVKRMAIVPGEYSEAREKLISTMRERGYELEKEEGENLSFRLRGPVSRFFRMFEDRLTFTRTFSGFEVEGYRKDVYRIINAL